MADDPTNARSAAPTVGNPTIDHARTWLRAIVASPHWPEEDKSYARTLLASHASLEERNKRLRDTVEFAADRAGELNLFGTEEALRSALAAFVNEKERT